MTRFVPSLVLVSSALFLSDAAAYKEQTHTDLAEQTVDRSALHRVDSGLWKALGLPEISAAMLDVARYPLPPQGAGELTVQDLVVLGVVREDNRPRYASHFFDPWNNRGLTPAPEGIPALAFEPSPDRALDALDQSLREARNWLVQGLTQESPENRLLFLAVVFVDLGQVVHHIQDMAQPEHTRNDPHLPPLDDAYEDEIEFCPELRDNIPDYLPGGAVVSLPTARSYWASSGPGQIDGLGLAEFSNRNFVTDGTNFAGGLIDGITNQIGFLCSHPEFDFPNGNGATIESVPLADLRNESPCTLATDGVPGIADTANVRFIRTPVTDNLQPGATDPQPRTTELRLFESDLRLTGNDCLIPLPPTISFREARFSRERRAEFVLKRAVAYGAGLIDHFFSGVVRPDGTPALRLKASRLTNEDGTLTITNASGRTLQSGSFSVYYDDRATGLRESAGSVALAGPVAPDTDFVVAQGDPGEGVQLSKLWTDGDTAGQVAIVFEGVAGNAPNEEEEIVAARVCDCERFLTDPLDEALLECSGVCPCVWLAFVDGSPGIPGDDMSVAGVVSDSTTGRKRFTFPDCMQGSDLVEDATVAVFATNPTIGVGNGFTVMRTVDDPECSLGTCGGSGVGSGAGGALLGQTVVNGVPGWHATYDTAVSGTTSCEGQQRILDDLHGLSICFTNEPSCPISAVDCCDRTVNLDAAMICFQANAFPANVPLP